MSVQNHTDLEHSKMIQGVMEGVETEKVWVHREGNGFILEPREQVLKECEDHLNKMICATDSFYIEEKDYETFKKIAHRRLVFYSAFTLTEILSKLPSYIKHNGSRYRLTSMKFNDNLYDITYYNTGAIACVESSRVLMEQEDINHKGFEQRCPTNAAARLLKWVSDNEHMEE